MKQHQAGWGALLSGCDAISSLALAGGVWTHAASRLLLTGTSAATT